MKKFLILLRVTLVAIFALMLTSLPIYAIEDVHTEDLLPIDAVLVLDVSLSMRTADPYQLSRDAMNLFIEMLTEGRDRVGIVAYAGQVEHSLALTSIYGQEDREWLRDFISQINYASWTDHGLGLIEAVDIISGSVIEGRQPVVIFFTDGNMNVSPHGARSNAIAQQDVERAIEFAQQNEFPIYTIGLNFDGQLASEYVQEIADATGGLAFETANAEDLPGIIRAIFSRMMAAPIEEEYLQFVMSEYTQPVEAEPYEFESPEQEYSPYTVEESVHNEEPGEQDTSYLPIPGSIENPPNENLIRARNLLLLAAVLILFAVLLLLWRRKPGRVFTGRVVLEVVDNHSRHTDPPQYRNLIEYGRRVTLHRLLGGEFCPALNAVALTPSPHSPSHLPQLLVKCSHPKIRLLKDFLTQDNSHGLTISPGAEMTVELGAEQKHIRLRYML